MIDSDVKRLKGFDGLFDDSGRATDIWDAAGDISDIIYDHARQFANRDPATFYALWDSISRGIISRERGVKPSSRGEETLVGGILEGVFGALLE